MCLMCPISCLLIYWGRLASFEDMWADLGSVDIGV
jgi:hypothetical protein